MSKEKTKKVKALAQGLKILFTDSKFVSFHRYKIEMEDGLYLLTNPGQAQYFTNLENLAEVLIDMIDFYA